jgi:PAS domain S-box-containing protein
VSLPAPIAAPPARRRVVILDGDPSFGPSLQHDFGSRDFDVDIVASETEAIASVETSLPALVVLDAHLPGSAAVQLLRRWQTRQPELIVVLVSGKASLNVIVDAMKEGALRFLVKPVTVDALLEKLEQQPRTSAESAPLPGAQHVLGTAALDADGIDRFFAISPGLLAIWGFDGYFKMLNPAWIKALGYTIEELCAKPHLELVHPEDREKARDEASELRGGHTVFVFKNRYRRKDGEYRWLEWHATPSPENRAVYASARDVTKTVRMEQGLRAANTHLEGEIAENAVLLRRSAEQNDLLVALGRAKEEVSSMLVHDLKNPLSVIVANYDFLVDGFEGSADCLEALQDSKMAGQRMLRLLENLLDVTRLENGALKLRVAPLEIIELIDALVEQRRILASARNVTVVRVPSPPITIAADQDLLTRVIENIFDNAFRHTPQGGRIEIRLERVGTNLEIRFGNSGVPVAKEIRPTIFEKHRHGTESSRLNLGLGLYFSRLAIEAHGGVIWNEETEAMPTVFGIRLPGGTPS